jgi:hypothetical protein
MVVGTLDLEQELESQLRAQLPWLRLYRDGTRLIARGTIVLHSSCRFFGSYRIEIEFPIGFPEAPPIVREIGGKIPAIADRHFYADGSACLFVEDEATRFWSGDIGQLAAFVNSAVRPFFWGQKYFEHHGRFFVEWSHGTAGKLEFYANLLGTKSRHILLSFLDLASSCVAPGTPCYCGSTKSLEVCHFEVLAEFRRVCNPETIRRTKKELLETRLPAVRGAKFARSFKLCSVDVRGLLRRTQKRLRAGRHEEGCLI